MYKEMMDTIGLVNTVDPELEATVLTLSLIHI